MAEVRPFCGVRYNEHMITDLSAVICPPYDIITPEMALELYWRSEYNFIRVEYGPQTGRDESPDIYARSAAMLESWLGKGILKTDEKPAIYLHDHLFAFQGKTHRRRGITVAVRLEEWEKRVVRPHESTLSKAKSDRLNLLFALKANTSPILALFEDGREGIAPILARESAKPPLIRVESVGEGSHLVWAITDPGAVREIAAKLADKPLYIADGHHRYESALNYQRQRRACSASVSGEEGFNFVMMTLVALNDPGLMVLSPHRLVRNVSAACLEELRGKLANLFDIEELPLATPGLWEQINGFLSCGQINETRLALFGLSREKFLLLKLRYPNAARQMMPYFHGELYTRLGVSVLDHVILEKMLGVGQGAEGASLDFCHDKQEAVKRVLDGEFQLAFLLCPVKTEMIKAMADAGERMPRKSTYFYPKLPTGLIFRRLD